MIVAAQAMQLLELKCLLPLLVVDSLFVILQLRANASIYESVPIRIAPRETWSEQRKPPALRKRETVSTGAPRSRTNTGPVAIFGSETDRVDCSSSFENDCAEKLRL